MSTTTIVVIVAVVALIALIASRRGGPRVTQIDRKVTREKEDEK